MAFLAAVVPYITAAAAAYGAYTTYQASKEAKKAVPGVQMMPDVEKPTAMPSADALTSRRSSVAELLRRRGRASTVLTETGQESLGAT